MVRRAFQLSILFIITVCLASPLWAQPNQGGPPGQGRPGGPGGPPDQGPPPALVVLDEAREGVVRPEVQLVGTVYYVKISDVAAEVSGKVEQVGFEAGQRVKSGQRLVKIDADLLTQTRLAKQAALEQVLVELEKARLDLKRYTALRREATVSEQAYDERLYQVRGLEKQAASLIAQVKSLDIELSKKVVKAPFDGVVVTKNIERGEWLSPGAKVATIASDELIDVIVNAPQEVVRFVSPGTEVAVTAGSTRLKGRVLAVIPQGDISTRSFPVRIRIENSDSLMEGMEAKVNLPTGREVAAMMIPRDAVVTLSGQPVVFTVIESRAVMMPIKVIGYEATSAGVEANGLKAGMPVVVKGNERLRNGQPVKAAPVVN